MERLKKRFCIIVGAAQSGKSAFLDKLLKGKKVIVYNVGTTGEFSECKETHTPTESVFRQKIYRVFDNKKENSIFSELNNISGNVVIDDSRAIFRNGVNRNFLSFCSRINHTCKGKGTNLFLVFHSFNQINTDLLTYATDFVIFKTELIEVDFKNDIGIKITNQITKAVEALQNEPRFSYVHIKK